VRHGDGSGDRGARPIDQPTRPGAIDYLTLTADVAFGEGERWVEVTPPGGGTALALTPGRGDYQPGRMTGIALTSPDPRADHSDLKGAGVAVDEELMGGDGTVPLMFFFRDGDGNQLLIVQQQEA